MIDSNDTPQPRSDEDLADALYGSTEGLMSSYAPGMQDGAGRLADVNGWSEEQRTEHLAEWSHAFSDARIPSGPASILHSLYVKYADSPPDQATLEMWSAESRQYLRETYGIEEGNRRVKMASEFLAARPALQAAVHASGMRSHPAFVKALTESPHNLRIQPRPRHSNKAG
jgi:hypothetical protein